MDLAIGSFEINNATVLSMKKSEGNVYIISLQCIYKSKGIPPNGLEFEYLNRKFRITGIHDLLCEASMKLPVVKLTAEEITSG